MSSVILNASKAVSSSRPVENVREPLTTFEKISRAANLRFAMIEAFLKNHLYGYSFSASNVVKSLYDGIIYAIPRIVRLIFGWSSTAVEKALDLKDMPLLKKLLDNGASLEFTQEVIYFLLKEVVADTDTEGEDKDIALKIISKSNDEMRSFRVTRRVGDFKNVGGLKHLYSETIYDQTLSSMGGGASYTRDTYMQKQSAEQASRSLYYDALDKLNINANDLVKAGIISNGVSREEDFKEERPIYSYSIEHYSDD